MKYLIMALLAVTFYLSDNNSDSATMFFFNDADVATIYPPEGYRIWGDGVVLDINEPMDFYGSEGSVVGCNKTEHLKDYLKTYECNFIRRNPAWYVESQSGEWGNK